MIIPTGLNNIVKAIEESNGTAMLIGGAVIDSIRGIEIKDWDVEVYGLQLDQLVRLLETFGKTNLVGKAFGVVKITIDEIDYDFSLPRKDNKNGVGHKGFEIEVDPNMSFEDAGRRRDLTINSMYLNLHTLEIVDPFGGMEDLGNGIIKVTDPKTFVEDPLRVMRIMQLLPRKGKAVDSSTLHLCRTMVGTFKELPSERLFVEFEKLLMKSDKPSIGLQFLKDCGWLQHFPALFDLIDCPQNPVHHPEGSSFQIVSSFNSDITSSTQTIGSYRGILTTFWEFFNSSLTGIAFSQIFNCAPVTESVMDSAFISLPIAQDTRTNFSFSPPLSSTITSTTKPMSFMPNFAFTITASKSIRVMFKIPESCVFPIVGSPINEFEIFRHIIPAIAVFMMDVNMSRDFFVSNQSHNKSVQINATELFMRNTFISPPVVVNSVSSVVNKDCFGSFHISFKDDVHFIDFNKGLNRILQRYGEEKITTNDEILYLDFVHGDVWAHTKMVIDNAAKLRSQVPEEWRLAFMFGCLLHDVGKPSTTILPELTAYGHDKAGVPIAESFMRQLTNNIKLIERVKLIVELHMRAGQLERSKAKSGAWKRLSNKCRLDILGFVHKADSAGRTGRSLEDHYPAAEKCFNWCDKLGVEKIEPLVMGRDLINLGMKPSALFSKLLKQGFEMQMEGSTREEIINFVKLQA